MGLFSFRERPVPGQIRARVIADSINPDGGRLTTIEATFNRYILAELNTHRMLSKNSASSRAIPVKRIMRQVWADPAVPIHWGGNQAGMQASSELSGWRRRVARRLFLLARIPALAVAWLLTRVGLHKQVTNRILEPWVWHTAIISATEWGNFFKLRDHQAAQPEFRVLARCMRIARDGSVPRQLEWGQWHLPYLPPVEAIIIAAGSDGDDPWIPAAKVSASCCARVSYVRQNTRKSVEEDVRFADSLAANGHFSPFEHVAQAEPVVMGNFSGFKQLRKFYPDESGRKIDE